MRLLRRCWHRMHSSSQTALHKLYREVLTTLSASKSVNSEEDVYELQGNLFFGSTSKFKEILNPSRYSADHVLLDVSRANLLDHSALEAIDSQTIKFKEVGKTLDLKNVQPESMKLIENSRKIYDINVVE